MYRVAHLVYQHPGHPMIYYAKRVGPHGSLRLGYAVIHRAIDAGLVDAVKGPRNSVLLFPWDD